MCGSEIETKEVNSSNGVYLLFLYRGPSPAPLARGFPLPLWRGVNGLANNGLITVLQTIVGRWSPRPVLQHPICLQDYSLPSPYGEGKAAWARRGRGAATWMGAGGRGTETTVLL